jgi:beta-glucanase (GH16 family)
MKTLVVCCFLVILSFHSQSQNWKLVWADEFSKNGLPDSTKWGNEVGFVRNKELQYYTKMRIENSRVEKGNLLIIGKKENYKGASYTSASLTTDGKHSWKYGKIEARIKIPVGQGIWPAFWLLGQNIHEVGWPKCGEVDIMEHINLEPKNFGTLHWENKVKVSSGGTIPCDFTKFHTYALEWDESAINWFLDGKKYWEVPIKDSINSTEEFHKPQYLILNLAIGGAWPGNPDTTTAFPDTMFVDYVRVYKKMGR